jgi:epoxyqueuosine reductase QueG
MSQNPEAKWPTDASLEDAIRTFVKESVARSQTHTRYRTPLVGFASADDPGWLMILERMNPEHLLPKDILPGAQTVVAFFVPFSYRVVTENKRHFYVSPEWAQAYVETNALIEATCRGLGRMLAGRHVRAAHQPPTHNFDQETLRSLWSHKSAAYVAGLGEWGLNRMLITERGCAGRLGSMVIDAAIPPTARPGSIYCNFYRDGSCMECVNRCQVGALRISGLDKERCYRTCLEVDFFYHSQFGKVPVCGKCATGPCAFRAPAKPNDRVE